MNAQERMIDNGTIRRAAIAVAAVAVLGLAAYLFGTGLRADTSASRVAFVSGTNHADLRDAETNRPAAGVARAVAPAALGASSLDARGARTTLSAARAAALAALAKSRADFYADQNAAAEAARWAAVAAADKDFAIFYSGVNATNAAADQARLESLAAVNPYQRMGFTSPESVGASSSAADPYQNEWMGFTSPESVGASSTAVNPYQRMGFTSPESVGASSSAADPSTSIKPEGIRPASQSGADQLQWIKPEGVKLSTAK